MAKGKAVQAEQPAAGCWHYIGRGTRIIGVPARTLTPSESELFDAVIRQAAAHGDVLYAWEPAVVVASVPAPEYATTTTAEVLDGERSTWAPGGTEHKDE